MGTEILKRKGEKMKIYTENMLEEYKKNDWILDLLGKEEEEADKNVRTHQWLKEMDNKRMIYADVYGDLLKESLNLSVLDVGGGYTSLTKRMLNNVDYNLLDFIAHGGEKTIGSIEKKCQKKFWINSDWMDVQCEGKPYDVVIANDIFPDVDQRMEIFIDKFLPMCKELRLVLTFYNTPKYYRAKRTDDLEVLTFLSWDGEITALKLKKYADRLIDTSEGEINKLKECKDSIYWNGRQVAFVKLKGDR